jgi:Na+/phosphate symporter
VSSKSVQRAKDVVDRAVPELVKAVEQNKVRVSAAAKKLVGKPPEEIKKILNDKKALAQAIKDTDKTQLDRLEAAWDKVDLATQQAFVEAKYQDLKKLMKAVDQKQKEAA